MSFPEGGVVHVVNDGGSAFPLNTANVANPGAFDAEPGMTLRDYFAAKALAGILANEGWSAGCEQWAYRIADAMLAARAGGAA